MNSIPTTTSSGLSTGGISSASSNIYTGEASLRDQSSQMLTYLNSEPFGPSHGYGLSSGSATTSGNLVNSLLQRDSHPSSYEQQSTSTLNHPPYIHSSSSSSASNYLHTSIEDEEGMKLFIGQVVLSSIILVIFTLTLHRSRNILMRMR